VDDRRRAAADRHSEFWTLVFDASLREPPVSVERPRFSQKTQTFCPRCNSDRIAPLAANNPGSLQEWFRCDRCDHMWSQRRDRSEQGEP
jgi:hypothetical protein